MVMQEDRFWRPSPYDVNAYSARRFHPVPYCIAELNYLVHLSKVQSQPRWWLDVEDRLKGQQWKDSLTDNEASFLQHELEHYATMLRHSTAMPVPQSTHGVFASDVLMESSILESMQRGSTKLKPSEHFGELALVDPSLYSAVNGRTRLSDVCNAVVGHEVVAWQVRGSPDDSISDKFQWLPCDVVVAGDGKASIRSYINNLHAGRPRRALRKLGRRPHGHRALV
ncbi:hypothetical protein Ae201684P_017845 [Aphanomyces euteiches]|uniref:DUF4246 domain-containing protein n=1 Tax=Aphanomyces euteiches TaxID=100861 RepID=A0A6G0XMX7_9STRA|nr:hypothetical protein Ae201684_003013 [Aphanomyces euteiches]KAH9098634.1 hypothetical protein Ae201684P_017845 [Aphanomyces euteiches]